MFTLRYPATGSTTESVQLRNPELGDIQRVHGEGIVRRTRGGDLKQYRDSNWPQGQTNVYEFRTLTATKKDELLSFMRDYAGLEIGIEDHHGYSWAGVIVSSPNEIVTTKDNCSYDVGFEFFGAKI